MRLHLILVYLLLALTMTLSSFDTRANEVCTINDDFKLTPEVDFDQIARACNWEVIFNISDYFSLEGLMNGLFKKLQDKAGGTLCKISVEDVWKDNQDVIGYRWPSDVSTEVAREVDKEMQEVLNVVMLPEAHWYKFGPADLDPIKMMLEVR